MSALKSQRRAQMKGTEEEIGTYAGLPGQIVISYQSGWRPYIMTGEAGGAVPAFKVPRKDRVARQVGERSDRRRADV